MVSLRDLITLANENHATIHVVNDEPPENQEEEGGGKGSRSLCDLITLADESNVTISNSW